MAAVSNASAPLYPWLRPYYNQLSRQFLSDRLHHAMLVHGVNGLGKSQLAQRLAELLQCGAPIEHKACGLCQSCRLHASVTHPDFYSIAPAADKTSISIDQIRAVQGSLVNTGLTNPVRVIVITQAESMTISAANALLKVLEEPAKDIYFILTCQRPALLPATVVSRCLAINVGTAPADKLAAWVSNRVGTVITVNQFGLFKHSPLQAVAGLERGFLTYVATLRDVTLDVIISNNPKELPVYPLLELIRAGAKDVNPDKAIGLIHLLIIDCVKIASGITIDNSFELSTAQMAALVKIDVARFLALEQGLNHLKQLFITQPGVNKLLQLQQVIVDFGLRQEIVVS